MNTQEQQNGQEQKENINNVQDKKFRFTPVRWAEGIAGIMGYGVGVVTGTVVRIPLALGVGFGSGFGDQMVKKCYTSKKETA